MLATGHLMALYATRDVPIQKSSWESSTLALLPLCRVYSLLLYADGTGSISHPQACCMTKDAEL